VLGTNLAAPRRGESTRSALFHLHVESESRPGYARRRFEESVVGRELRSLLDCAILTHGFVRVRCDACGHDGLVGFSCKGRGFCPSCGGRLMADTAVHLVDRVFRASLR
jgi:ribosomal protein S27E